MYVHHHPLSQACTHTPQSGHHVCDPSGLPWPLIIMLVRDGTWQEWNAREAAMKSQVMLCYYYYIVQGGIVIVIVCKALEATTHTLDSLCSPYRLTPRSNRRSR